MLGYPLLWEVERWGIYLRGTVYSETVLGVAALLAMVIWLGVGALLYERKAP